jgi:hypothetical protein
MNKHDKNDQPSSSENEGKNAGGIDDIDIDIDVDVDEENEGYEAQQAGGGRRSENEEPRSPDSRWGSQRKS